MLLTKALIGFNTIAQEVNKRTVLEVQPLELRAPEVILGYPWSTPIDIWSVGCLVMFQYFITDSIAKMFILASFVNRHLNTLLEYPSFNSRPALTKSKLHLHISSR
jgi:serine/threonine-protein kinase SRPK3